MTTAAVAASEPWYRSLNATQWKTVFASNLGWMFDGYETFALILVVGVALRDLLDPSQFAQIPAFAGTIIGITLLGWGIGGVIGGVLADYIGRRRTMIFAILAYSITTGLSAFAWDWVSFALLRFLVGVAVGDETEGKARGLGGLRVDEAVADEERSSWAEATRLRAS